MWTSRTTRRALAGCGVLAVLRATALVAQSWALATVLADLVRGTGAPIGERLGVLAGAVLARALLGWAEQVVAARAAAGAKAELRATLLDRSLAAGPEWIVHSGPAELTALATRGLDSLDAYFTGYLPALVHTAVLPLGAGAVLLVTDSPSAVVVGLFVLLLVPECYAAPRAAHHAGEDGIEAARRVAELPPPAPAPTGGPVTGDLVVTDLKVRRRNGFTPSGLSFTARPGEITRLDSPSGTGKSTVLTVLLGYTRRAAGTIEVNGVPLETMDPEAWRRTIAWVPQHPTFTARTVAEELTQSLADRETPRPDRRVQRPRPVSPTFRDELVDVTALVAAEHLLDRPTEELSAGERQRVAVARALLRVRHGASLLLLDEPTAHLDPATAGRVMTAVEDAAAAGVTVVLAGHRTAGVARERLVTHDVDIVLDLTPRVLTPSRTAGLVIVAAVLVQLAILPAAVITLVIAVAAAGVGAPAVAFALDRRAGTTRAADDRRLATGIRTLLDAAAELVAVGAHHRHRDTLVDGTRARTACREAFGAATLVVTLATGAATIAGTYLAAAAVTGGTLDPLLAPIPALLPLVLAEVLRPPAAQPRTRLDTVRAPVPAGTGRDIELRGVDVRWPGAAEPVLRDVTLDVPHGSYVAVTGPSGAGKSTLLALLLGVLPAERGTARIPCGATAISGGEAGRLALADVLLLDEPTAHLDEPTARTVLANLRATGRTIVHVTHRPEDAEDADLVVELDASGRLRTLSRSG